LAAVCLLISGDSYLGGEHDASYMFQARAGPLTGNSVQALQTAVFPSLSVAYAMASQVAFPLTHGLDSGRSSSGGGDRVRGEEKVHLGMIDSAPGSHADSSSGRGSGLGETLESGGLPELAVCR